MFINSRRKKPHQSRCAGLYAVTLISLISIITPAYFSIYQDPVLAEPTTIPVSKLGYFSDTFGIRIDYPGEWGRTHGSNGAVGENITIVKFSLCQDQRVNVALTIDKLSENTTLKEYTNEKINSVSSLPSSILSSNEITQHNSTRINIYPGYEMTVKSNIPLFWNAFSTISTDYWTVTNATAYGILYTAPSDQHSVYLPVVREMVDSFEIGVKSALIMVPANTSYDNASVSALPQC